MVGKELIMDQRFSGLSPSYLYIMKFEMHSSVMSL